MKEKRRGSISDRALDSAWERQDVSVIVGAYRYFVSRGFPDSEKTLIFVLDYHGHKDMAEAYLNCGNEKLADAAHRWAKQRKYIILPGSSGSWVQWGSRK